MSRFEVSDLRVRFFLSADRTISPADHQMGSHLFPGHVPGRGL